MTEPAPARRIPEDGLVHRLIGGSTTREVLDMRIDEVEGISSSYAQKLSAAGVSTTGDLLDKDRSRAAATASPRPPGSAASSSSSGSTAST
jgi:hypothetical protein